MPGEKPANKRRGAADDRPQKKAKRKEKDAAEKELEGLLFGEEDEEEQVEEELIIGADEEDSDDEEPVPAKPTAAWQDEDDEQVEVDIDQKGRTRKLRETEEENGTLSGVDYVARLRALKSTQTKGTNDWADQREDEDDDDGLRKLARQRGGLVSKNAQSTTLAPNMLKVKRLKDANTLAPSKAVIQEVKFHQTLPILLAAGFDKTLRLFQADGQANNKLQSVFLKDLPIKRAAFLPGTESVLMCGRRPFFYVYDMGAGKAQRVAGITGVHSEQLKSLEDMCVSPSAGNPLICFLAKDGYSILVDSRNRRSVGTLKMNGSVRAATFSADGMELLTGGDEGSVYVWDVRTQRCRAKVQDDGALRISSIATSADGKYWATGSDSGVVNVYDGKASSVNQKPLKAIMNLTTQVDNLKFNHDSQMLAISSRFKKEALKMVHLDSMTVFQNWPTLKTPLSTVSSVDFSPNSYFTAIGNDKGKVLVYNLCHYFVA